MRSWAFLQGAREIGQLFIYSFTVQLCIDEKEVILVDIKTE